MTPSTAALRPGAAHKTATWRAGALIFGWGLLLLLLRIILSAWLSVSGRLFLTLLVLGFVLTVPYGWAAVRGRVEPRAGPRAEADRGRPGRAPRAQLDVHRRIAAAAQGRSSR